MLTLSNSQLTVQLLDPSSPGEYALQGSRFCWGGYVWQVEDSAGGLLSGPEYPHATPDPFNGQGLPEAFRCRSQKTGDPLTMHGSRGFVIGAGDVEVADNGEVRLLAPARWSYAASPGALEFTCEQRFADWHTVLDRRIVLQDRSLTSCTRLRNLGTAELPVHWFPHPFFPLVEGRTNAAVPIGYGVDDNPVFSCSNGRLEQRCAFPPGDPGHFQPLTATPVPLAGTVAHPRLRGIRMRCDYVPAAVPVWANHRTFSIEPYLHTALPPGGRREWRVRYDFLSPS